MSVYRVTPAAGAPCLRCAPTLARATARAQQEFPAGVLALVLVELAELDQLVREGAAVPMEGRRRVEVYRAVQRERERGAARVQAVREKVREEARQKRAAARAAEEARKADEKERQRAEREAEKKRQAAAARTAQRSAEQAAKLQQERQEAQQVVAPPVMPQEPAWPLEMDDTRAPWDQ